jgi:hypothetical protein
MCHILLKPYLLPHSFLLISIHGCQPIFLACIQQGTEGKGKIATSSSVDVDFAHSDPEGAVNVNMEGG